MARATCGEVTGHENQTTGELCKKPYGSCPGQELIETKAELERVNQEFDRVIMSAEKDEVIQDMGRVIAEKDRVIREKDREIALAKEAAAGLAAKDAFELALIEALRTIMRVPAPAATIVARASQVIEILYKNLKPADVRNPPSCQLPLLESFKKRKFLGPYLLSLFLSIISRSLDPLA